MRMSRSQNARPGDRLRRVRRGSSLIELLLTVIVPPTTLLLLDQARGGGPAEACQAERACRPSGDYPVLA